ncbi:gamma-glutamylcyclotransferase family protein [Streptomyces sp. ODS28]|uniref:gamma-glutamylcyclotransferase family protein n=1 Tax=Streptomyces sp. ODS28 TaxID=3136688 RepID=UPI0031ECA8D6
MHPAAPPDRRLFVYGTLRFAPVLTALLGRVPDSTPAEAPGWRAAALRGRPYPGLVPAEPGLVRGRVLTGLSGDEWRRLDDFEGPEYVVQELALKGGGTALAYVWAMGDVLPQDWDPDEFEARHMHLYV